jgi:outer membrane lipoprotein-sorting protein
METRMVIIKKDRKLNKEMITWIQGSSNSFTKFISPQDRGTKYLKREDNLWMFFPEAEDIVKISGHMLEQGMMGSAFSYQDMMESSKLTDLYKFEIIREEEVRGRPCYVVEGVKKEDKEASYYRRVSWVDKERQVLLKEELYARSGRLLKKRTNEKIEKLAGRWFPTRTVMEDKLQKDTKTEFIIESIEFNVEIPERLFSLQRLRN